MKTRAAGKSCVADRNVDLWFSGESGFEGDPRPRRTWTKIGKVRHSPYLGKHIRANVFGAARPKDGRLVALLFNLCGSVTFQVFLDTLAEEDRRPHSRRTILKLGAARPGELRHQASVRKGVAGRPS